MQILEISRLQDLRKVMQEIRVDPWGIKIMLPKAITHLLRINSLSNISANILKQEMLSLGGDAALNRDALTGRAKKTDCLLIGNLAQFNRLFEKLKLQPFGLGKLSVEISAALSNYNHDKFILRLGRYKLNLGSRTHIMGIVNITADSFSGDGLYKQGQSPSGTVPVVEKMIKDGADIIDIGGESSRPGAKPVSVKEEIKRAVPVIRTLARLIKVPLSIDTYKPEVAKSALDNGATLVNDISGLKDPAMLKLVSRYKAAVVIMHMKGSPLDMQRNPRYTNLIDEITRFLKIRIEQAQAAGIGEDSLIIDPGLGFGKTLEHNFQILKRLSEFKVLGKPILVGPSRKSFIGKILKCGPKERLFGTVSACVLAARNGARILRVHDVRAIKEALKVYEAIRL